MKSCSNPNQQNDPYSTNIYSRETMPLPSPQTVDFETCVFSTDSLVVDSGKLKLEEKQAPVPSTLAVPTYAVVAMLAVLLTLVALLGAKLIS